MNNNFSIPPCFYRVSIKALILDETRTKFLVMREENDEWELPGGGLDWGATPQEDLRREIEEEMRLPVEWVAANPSYFITFTNHRKHYVANVVYEARVAHTDFKPSDECVEIRFVTTEEVRTLPARFANLALLADMFEADVKNV